MRTKCQLDVTTFITLLGPSSPTDEKHSHSPAVQHRAPGDTLSRGSLRVGCCLFPIKEIDGNSESLLTLGHVNRLRMQTSAGLGTRVSSARSDRLDLK